MSEQLDFTPRRVFALLAVALIAGALVAGWRARPRRTASAGPADEVAFAAPLIKQRSAPLTTRVFESFKGNARPLPDALFADPEEQGTPQFAQVGAMLIGPDVQLRALGRPEGHYVRRRTDGWHTFVSQKWMPVKGADVPGSIRRLWPDPDPAAMRAEPASRDGEVEAL